MVRQASRATHFSLADWLVVVVVGGSELVSFVLILAMLAARVEMAALFVECGAVEVFVDNGGGGADDDEDDAVDEEDDEDEGDELEDDELAGVGAAMVLVLVLVGCCC